jgi:hypothetical protein
VAANKGGQSMSTKQLCKLLLISAIFLIFVASQPQASDEFLPSSNGAALWSYITHVNPYQGYHFWIAKEGYYKGRDPHGAILRTFVNPQAYLDLKNGKPQFSNGAMIVKEGYTADFQPLMTVVMYKIKDYNPGANDWFWVKYSPDGKVEKEGKVEGCIKCHSGAMAVDYAFSKTP